MGSSRRVVIIIWVCVVTGFLVISDEFGYQTGDLDWDSKYEYYNVYEVIYPMQFLSSPPARSLTNVKLSS